MNISLSRVGSVATHLRLSKTRLFVATLIVGLLSAFILPAALVSAATQYNPPAYTWRVSGADLNSLVVTRLLNGNKDGVYYMSARSASNIGANDAIVFEDAANSNNLFRIYMPSSTIEYTNIEPGGQSQIGSSSVTIDKGIFTQIQDVFASNVYVWPTNPADVLGNTINGLSQNTLGVATGTSSEALSACEDNVTLGWLICPVIFEFLDAAITALDTTIIDLFTVDEIYNDPNQSLYKVWGAVRNIAFLILVPMMLVMVIGTALEFGPFDAYTVKKALPRMIAAVMFIALSWQICTFFINMSDLIGNGTMNFIEASAGATCNGEAQPSITLAVVIGCSSTQTDIAGAGAGVGGYIATIAIGGGAFLVGGISIGIILSFALTLILGLLIGYVSLAIRLILILGLLVFSPLFILSWIFPGNDKMWKFWRTTFVSMLLVFPLIMGAIGVGRVGAYIISQIATSSQNQTQGTP